MPFILFPLITITRGERRKTNNKKKASPHQKMIILKLNHQTVTPSTRFFVIMPPHTVFSQRVWDINGIYCSRKQDLRERIMIRREKNVPAV